MHRLALTTSCRIANPAHSESLPAFSPHFYGYLIISATDTLGTHLRGRTDIFHRKVKNFKRVWIACFFFYYIKCFIHYFPRSFFLSGPHYIIDKLLQFLRIVDKIWSNYISIFYFSSHIYDTNILIFTNYTNYSYVLIR